MVTKIALILLLVGLPVAAQDDGTMLEWPIHPLTLLWSPIDTLRTHHRHTTRYYIKEIKQKCDTAFVPITPNICDSGILNCGCGHYTTYCSAKIKCVDDTVWADKVQVWLTPDQLEQLFDMIKEREQMLDRKWKDALRGMDNGEAPPKKLKGGASTSLPQAWHE